MPTAVDTVVSNFSPASALDGTEKVPVIQGGADKLATVSNINKRGNPHPGYVAANWYVAPVGGFVAAGAIIPALTTHLLGFVLTQPITVSALAARVSTISASGNFQLAIYANLNGKPTGVPLCKSSANMSTGVAGPVSTGGALSANVTLAPGLYWAAVMVDNAVAIFQTISPAAIAGGVTIGDATLANLTTGAAGLGSCAWSAPYTTFGTWPDLTSATFTDVTGASHALQFLLAA